MIQTLNKNWWLLALCGVFEAIISVIYAIMYDTGPDGPLTAHGWRVTAVFLSRLALAAGVCTIAAGIWRFAIGTSWLLVLNGLAFSAYGLIPLFWRGSLNFVLFARLLVVMALSIGVLELVSARTLRRQRHVTDGWFLGLAGAASVRFCLGVSCFGVWLDPTGTQAFSPFTFSLAGPLLWLQRNLHVMAGPAPWSFPIRPVGSLTTTRKSKTRTLINFRWAFAPNRSRRMIPVPSATRIAVRVVPAAQ